MSEPDTERDEERVTVDAVEMLYDNGQCPLCKERAPNGFDDADDARRFRYWSSAHAETCTPLRERVVARMEKDRE